MGRMECDVVVVGGGSAGCVIASRLSEDRQRRVVLLEAGRDMAPDRIEPEILDSYPRVAYFNERNVWADLRVHLTNPSPNRPQGPPRRYEQARLIGGGSSLNDMQANRGLPDDYDEWAALGADGWDWQSVLPYFRTIERDLDFAGPLHGDAGPIPIRRIGRDVWPAFTKAACDAWTAEGFANLHDQNAAFTDGWFPVAISNYLDRRVSSAIGYLTTAVRARPNLTVLGHAEVREVTWEGRTVRGVEAVIEDEAVEIACSEVVVCAGALHSPALLMRSGIGPAHVLAQAGVPVRVARRGVGRNLQEHPTLSISAVLKRGKRLPDTLRRHIHVALRWSSLLEGCPASDMYMVCVNKTGWHAVGRQVGSLMTWVNKSHSRGRVEITSPAPDNEPFVDFNMLSDRRDLERLKLGMRFIARLFEHESVQAVCDNPFPTSYSERIRDLGVVSTKNRVLTAMLATALDGPSWVRRALIRTLVTEGTPLDKLLADDLLLEVFVKEKVHGVWHASGTCRMGSPEDDEAVVDPDGRVIGVEGLRVADASVMPVVPRANTNLPTLMIAEKIAAGIRKESVHGSSSLAEA